MKIEEDSACERNLVFDVFIVQWWASEFFFFPFIFSFTQAVWDGIFISNLGDWNQQKFIVSQFWGPGVWNQDVSGAILSLNSLWKNPFSPFESFEWHSNVFGVLWLLLLHSSASLFAKPVFLVSALSAFPMGRQSLGWGPTLNHTDDYLEILNQFYLQGPHFSIVSYSKFSDTNCRGNYLTHYRSGNILPWK